MQLAPTRRDFLKSLPATAATTLAWLHLARTARPAVRRVGANDKIGVGLIGCGGLGVGHHLATMLRIPDLDVRAVCDVDRAHIADAVKMLDGAGKKVATFGDHRKLLESKDIDAVLIATTDHWHAHCAIHACEAGKDVYCEKPLTLTIAEGRQMVEAVRRYGRVLQTGSQQRSTWDFRWAVDLVRNGAVGELKKITAAINRGPTSEFEPDQEPPAGLDWNQWLGQAPWSNYTPKRCHFTFRWFEDYSGGRITDWGAHHLDVAQWALDADASGPVEVEGKATFPTSGLFDTVVTFDVNFRYANGVRVNLTSEGENGVTFEGTKGKIFVSRERIDADPIEILDTPPDCGRVRLYPSPGHHEDWIACMRERRRPTTDVEVGHRSATVCHLANIAVRLKRPLKWDAKHERFEGDEEANRMTWRPKRAPWSLEGRA